MTRLLLKTALAFLVVGILAIAFLCIRSFQPWMPAGRTFQISSWDFGGYEFEIWQRKTTSIAEPFYSHLFARSQSNEWAVYYLDHEDFYRPSYELVMESNYVRVSRGQEQLGHFNLTTGACTRTGASNAEVEERFQGPPPGKW